MKLAFLRIAVFLLSALVLVNCKSSKKEKGLEEKLGSDDYLVFLDKSQAEARIVKDAKDGFFETISITDMSVQMKKSDLPASRPEVVAQYREFLKSEMESFTEEEKDFMREVFNAAKAALDKINPNLLPERIELIKTKTNHYGPDVYYTREKAIILPSNIFEEKSVEAQMPIMLHEIFHILSRYNKDFREKLYALIGFIPIDSELILPRKIEDKLLCNPDGVSKAYAINLVDLSGKSQLALPLIMSTKDRYQSNMPTFFSYLYFDLFPLIKITENQVSLGLNKQGDSSLGAEHNANFFDQIKDNTQYIIHPDEILADNFMMAVIAHKNETFVNFSPEGIKLLEEVLDVLRTFE
ncbi:MAG: hypothetical protein AAGA77_17005 [Bacteroidota bacterium]